MWVAWGATTGVEVTPLDWPGEAVPAKVLMIGLKDGRFLGYAVADLSERKLKVYPAGHIHSDIGTNGGSITSRGDVLIDGAEVAYLVPGGDFTEPSIPVRPSRYVSKRDVAGSLGFVTDPSGYLVWIYQDVKAGRWPRLRGPTNRIKEMWVDLFDVDTGEIVLTAEIRGDWRVAGALQAGLLLRESRNRVLKVNRYTIDSTVLEEPGRILILRPDGRREYVTPDLDGTPNLEAPAERWRQGFGIWGTYGSSFALMTRDEGEMFVVEADTGVTHPVPKPRAGVWRWTGLPEINIESSSSQNSDVFLTLFQTTVSGQLTNDWSLHEVRLSDQSVRKLHESRLRAKSVANGTAALAFTGWPVSPDNDAVINLIGPNGELIPVAAAPDDFFFLDAS